VYDSLIPDEERHYAPQAAAALGVGIDFFVADRYQPFEGFDESGVSMPEPSHDPFLLMQKRQLQWTTRHSRVLLSGLGGDEVLWPSYVVDVAHKLGPWELLEGFARSTLIHRRRPGFGVRARAERWFRAGSPPHGFPRWLNREFADRVDLRARWASVHHADMEHRHAIRGEAHRRLAGVPWPWCFEPFDAGASGVPAECRYPFLDVRLVEYLLAIPPFPWCVDKQLLRLSLQGVLPESLRTRPKTPMSNDPLREHLRRQTGDWWQRSAPAPELARFVDTTRIPSLTAPDTPDDVEVHVRPLCLNYWLCRARSSTVS
jgi:asparagine synthase (glutamine-hydrolysing)